MKPEDFELFVHLVRQRSGILLTRDKAYFIESRLLPIARKHNLKSLEDVAQLVRVNRDEKLMNDIVEAVATNETRFFRDRVLFHEFRQSILPQLVGARKNKRHIRIWSAGCSSGQEAYSLAMLLADDEIVHDGWRIDIVGTDLSTSMIARAKQAAYTQFEVQLGLPIRMLVKHFQQLGPDKWQVKEDVRRMVQFHEGNILHDLGPIGIFDAIFCRNVITHFDEPTRLQTIETVTNVLAPDGVLLLGRSETAGGHPRVKPLNEDNGFYVLAQGQPLQAMA